jgi:hypothetical protein
MSPLGARDDAVLLIEQESRDIGIVLRAKCVSCFLCRLNGKASLKCCDRRKYCFTIVRLGYKYPTRDEEREELL